MCKKRIAGLTCHHCLQSHRNLAYRPRSDGDERHSPQYLEKRGYLEVGARKTTRRLTSTYALNGDRLGTFSMGREGLLARVQSRVEQSVDKS